VRDLCSDGPAVVANGAAGSSGRRRSHRDSVRTHACRSSSPCSRSVARARRATQAVRHRERIRERCRRSLRRTERRSPVRRAATVLPWSSRAARPRTVQLFDEAERLVASGKYADACPKYAESNRLDPQLGVLMYLADCYEENPHHGHRPRRARARRCRRRRVFRPERSERRERLEPALPLRSRRPARSCPFADRSRLSPALVLPSASKHGLRAQPTTVLAWSPKVHVPWRHGSAMVVSAFSRRGRRRLRG
jgi:hypothetical protein